MEPTIQHVLEELSKMRESIDSVRHAMARHEAQEEHFLDVLKSMSSAQEKQATVLEHQEVVLSEHIRRTVALEKASEQNSEAVKSLLVDRERVRGGSMLVGVLGGLGGLAAIIKIAWDWISKNL